MENHTITLIKKIYPHISKEFDVDKIGVFGSVAKNLANESSDIDIVVKFRKPIGLKFIELVEYLENLFQKKVDLLTEEGVKNIRNKKISTDIVKNIIYVQT